MTLTSATAVAVNATKTYGEGDSEVHALDGISVQFDRGRFNAIMGPSGSGKSTLMHCMAGLDSLTSGSVSIAGIDLAPLNDRALTTLRREQIGFVFQAFNLIPTLNAYENIVLPLSLGGRTGDKGWIDQVIDTIGLRDRLNHRPSELSGGQQQRVAIARVLTQHSKVLLADEPVASLDPESARLVLEDLKRIAKEHNIAVLCSLHQVNLAKKYADRIIGMRAGELVFDGSSKDFCAQTEQCLYAKAHSGIPADENHSTV